MIPYTILPPSPRSNQNPVIRFRIREVGFPDSWDYDVTAGPSGFDWRSGHRPVQRVISPEEELEAWEQARGKREWEGDDIHFIKEKTKGV